MIVALLCGATAGAGLWLWPAAGIRRARHSSKHSLTCVPVLNRNMSSQPTRNPVAWLPGSDGRSLEHWLATNRHGCCSVAGSAKTSR